MEFKLTVLGTASAMPVTGRNQSAQVLSVHGRFFLIDCGEDTQRQLLRRHIPMMKIDSIFISHIHGDHIFGLFGLLSTMGMKARTAPLNIYAPANFGPILKFFMSYFGEGMSFEPKHIPLSMKEPGTIYQTKSIEVKAFPLNHKIDTFGFIFSEKEPPFNVHKDAIEELGLTLTEIGTLKRGEDVVREDLVIPVSEAAYKPFVPKSYAYVSDTAVFPQEAEWLKGVDVIYHETTYLDELKDQAEKRHHSTTIQAAQVAKDAGARKLIIGHYSSRVPDTALYEAECRSVFPESSAAQDGDIFDIESV